MWHRKARPSIRPGSSTEGQRRAHYRTLTLAAVAAGLLMLGSHMIYYAVAAQAADTTSKIPLDPAVLEQFPQQIGDWVGQDVPLDEATRERTGADTIISRRYARRNGTGSVGVYIASGITTRALVGHRPEVCFVSSGWTVMERRALELPLPDGRKLPCTLFQFSRGMLNAAQLTVLHYYIVDGQYCGDVSLLRRKAWRGSALVDYATQVRITAAGEYLTTESALRLLSTFATDSAPCLKELFRDRDAGRAAGETYTGLEGK